MHRFELINTVYTKCGHLAMQLSSTQHPLLHIHKIHHAYTIYIMHTQYIMSHQPINRDAFRLYAASSPCVELNEIQDNCMTATLGSYLKLNLLFNQICSLDIGIWCISSIFNVVSCVEHNYI